MAIPYFDVRQPSPARRPFAYVPEVPEGVGPSALGPTVGSDGWLAIRPTDRLYVREWEPTRRELDALRALSPKPDRDLRNREYLDPSNAPTGWLYLHWEAGDPWIPGQRWVLYEMIHRDTLYNDGAILGELEGPHPRSEGHMCSVNVPEQFQCLCRRKFEGWRGGPCSLITLTQYQLYQRTGYFAKPFWIVQGANGGHKWHFNEQEEAWARQANLPDSPPALGDLPYAPFDERVLRHIVRHNRLRLLGLTLSEYRTRMTHYHEVERKRAAVALRTEYLKWMDEQLREVNELFISAARKGDMEKEPTTDVNWEKVEEAAMGHYVETGDILHPSQIQ